MIAATDHQHGVDYRRVEKIRLGDRDAVECQVFFEPFEEAGSSDIMSRTEQSFPPS
jgi:hypothetical protein